MIGRPPGISVWLACGRTDMRKGMDGLAMLAQQVLTDDPIGGAVFAFCGRRGSTATEREAIRSANRAACLPLSAPISANRPSTTRRYSPDWVSRASGSPPSAIRL